MPPENVKFPTFGVIFALPLPPFLPHFQDSNLAFSASFSPSSSPKPELMNNAAAAHEYANELTLLGGVLMNNS